MNVFNQIDRAIHSQGNFFVNALEFFPVSDFGAETGARLTQNFESTNFTLSKQFGELKK